MASNENENKSANTSGPTEIQSWDDTPLIRDNVLRGIYAIGFEQPSPIQKKGIIPMIRTNKDGKRRDIIAQAQSGTGKTGCFSVGVLNIVNPENNYTQALVLAPTHELAGQIRDVITDLGRFDNIVTQLLVGGTSVDGDREKLDNNPPHIIVGTPGRVHDMIRRKYLKTEKIQVIVLDEADEMLSQGFKDQIYKIFQYMPSSVQIGLFSATMPPECEALSDKFMNHPNKPMTLSDKFPM